MKSPLSDVAKFLLVVGLLLYLAGVVFGSPEPEAPVTRQDLGSVRVLWMDGDFHPCYLDPTTNWLWFNRPRTDQHWVGCWCLEPSGWMSLAWGPHPQDITGYTWGRVDTRDWTRYRRAKLRWDGGWIVGSANGLIQFRMK